MACEFKKKRNSKQFCCSFCFLRKYFKTSACENGFSVRNKKFSHALTQITSARLEKHDLLHCFRCKKEGFFIHACKNSYLCNVWIAGVFSHAAHFTVRA